MRHLYAWTETEIDQLRLDFLRGLSIKAIARSMDRTPTSVNKALSRFHIRTPRIFKQRQSIPENPSNPSKRRKHLFDKNSNHSLSWTPFSVVLEWLKNQGNEVMLSAGQYYIGRRPHTAMQVVMFANKMRNEQGLDIFLVENLTW